MSATMGAMVFALVALVAVFFLIIAAERLRKSHKLKPEITRKFIHITVGSFVAFWPFFMPDYMIYGICLAFIAVVTASRFLGFFPSIHKVDRKTWGDVLFPLGIAATLLLAGNDWIFAASILHLSLADGFAALAGERFGAKNSYRIWGYKKTLAGNAAFFLISLVIVGSLAWLDPANFINLSGMQVIAFATIATVLESVAIRGSDNIVVPLAVVLLLNQV